MKKYLVETLVGRINGKHGYPKEAGIKISGNDTIRVQTPVGDTGAMRESSEIVSYSAISEETKSGLFEWVITKYTPIT